MFIGLLIAIGLMGTLLFVWRLRYQSQVRRRVAAERALADMSERLSTGVYQFRQFAGGGLEGVFANRAARDLVGLGDTAPPIIPRNVFEHVHVDDRRRIQRAITRSAQTGCLFSEACRFQFPGGRWGWFVNEACALPQADGSTLWNGFVVDLTDERAINDSLRKLLHQKRDFVVTAGHELRTPVHTLLLAAHTLLARDIGAVHKEVLRDVSHRVNQLGKFVDGLLQLSKLDAGEDVFENRPVDLRRVLAKVFEPYQTNAANSTQSFAFCASDDLPACVLLDEERFARLMHYLIDSALSYSPDSEVFVSVGAVVAAGGPSGQGDQESCCLHVKVTDSGEQASSVSQAGDPTSAGPDETQTPAQALRGLGMSIADRLVGSWGGTLSVESAAAGGTLTQVALPLELSQVMPCLRTEPAMLRRPGGHTVRILFVDDDAPSRALLSSLLRERGFEVTEAGSAEHGAELLQTLEIDVVLLDHNMPGMTGLELAIQMRRNRLAGDCPVVIGMTGGMADQDLSSARLAFDRLLFKPVNLAGLLEVIESAVLAPQVDDPDD